MTDIYIPEGFYSTTLSADINASTATIPLTVVPSRQTKGYMVIEPTHATKREVIHFTSVGASSVTTADDTTDASDATGRGCTGSITVGANTSHAQGVTVWIASTENYFKRIVGMLDGTYSTVTLLSPALTTPKITTSINDANGNEVMKTPATASAVNEITVTNAAAGGVVEVSATGGDTDIGLTLASKGTDLIKLKSGSTTTVGHSVPNVADDTVALLAAAQALTNKTITSHLAYADTRSKVIAITRDGTAATASVAYTGVGFTPTSMEVTYVVNDTVYSGRGFCDSARTAKATFTYAADLYLAGDYFISYTDKNNWGQTCIVASFDEDGFTLTWTKAGSPSAGTITAQVICHR